MPESSLSYNPASNITLPGIGAVELRGLILIVGPNSAGKTQFLTDIRAAITGTDRKPVVCESITLMPPDDPAKFLEGLEESRCLRRNQQKNQEETFTVYTSVLGTEDKVEQGQIGTTQLTAWLKDFSKPQNREGFMKFFGKLLITTLFLPNRLDTTKHCQVFNHQKEAPKNDLQALHMTSEGQRQLNNEIVRAFGKSIAIDSSTPHLHLKVFDDPESEPPRCWPDDTKGLPIEQEGDGLRSFVAISISLLAGHRPVCVIDEPESCLHPPQAHALGQFIGRHGSSKSRTTLVATHSSHVLRGVAETAGSVQIIRLSQNRRRFSAHVIDYNVLMESINKPIVRAETVLDGVFADGVIVVESDGDRAVYQAALEAATSDGRFDVLFVPVGGHGSIPSISTFYRRLMIPVASIADLDLVLEQNQLRNVLTQLSPQATESIDRVIQLCDQVSTLVMAMPPPIDATALRQEILSSLNDESRWDKSDNTILMTQLREMANKIDRRKVLKAGGVTALSKHAEIAQLLAQIIDACKPMGLHLVPVGELEYWCPNLMAGVSKRKAEWANEASLRIAKQPDDAKDVIDFVRAIAVSLEGERDKQVRSSATT